GCSNTVIAKGVDRDPGEITTSVTPLVASSSIKFATYRVKFSVCIIHFPPLNSSYHRLNPIPVKHLTLVKTSCLFLEILPLYQNLLQFRIQQIMRLYPLE